MPEVKSQRARASQDGFTRREFVYTTGAAIAGLAVGGGLGYALAPSESSSGGGGTASSEPIKIGGAYMLTGGSAADGADMLNGLELGVDDINAAGGVLGRELVVEQGDIESDLAPDKISAVLQKMTSGGASAIFMGWASFPSSEFDVIARTGTPCIHSNAYSGNTDYVAQDLEKYGSIFMSRPTEFSYARGFAAYLQELEASGQYTSKNKTIGVVTATDGYSLNIAKAFKESMEKAGYTQVLYEKFTPPLSEWGPILAKVRAKPADILFFSDYITGDAATFTKQFRTDPTPSLLFINLSPSSPEFYELVGDAANGVFWSSVSATLPDTAGQDFLQRLEQKTGQKPGLSAPGSQYDGVHMWALAASMAGDPDNFDAVVKNLRTLKYRGVNGTINFNPPDQAALAYPDQVTDPTLGMPTVVYQAQNQTNVVVSPAWLAAGKFQMPSWVK